MAEATLHVPRAWLNALAPKSACEPTARRIAQGPHGTGASTAASGDPTPAQAPEAAKRPRRDQRPAHSPTRPHAHAMGCKGAYAGEIRDRGHVPFAEGLVERFCVVKRLRAQRAPHRVEPARPLRCE